MTRQLRLAFLLSALRPGGAERQMLTLAQRLPHEGFDVDFLVMSGPGDYDSWAREAGAEVILVGQPPRPGEHAGERLARLTRLLEKTVSTIRRGRYDIVDAWLYPADVLAAMVRTLTHSPAIVAGRRNLGERRRFGPASRLVDRGAYLFTDAVVANSPAAARHALQAHHVDPSRLHVIRNGVLPVPPIPPATRARLRSEFGAEDGEVLVACVGNYREVKRHDHLIAAFARIATRAPRAKLLLIGSGPMRAAIERQVTQLGFTDRVRVHGPVADARPFYRAFDIVVQASESEGLPNVMLEAAAAGRAIVATDAGGTNEVVVHNETGILVPVGDAEALAAGMLLLAQEPETRVRLGNAAENHVLQAFGVDSMVSDFASLYRALVADRTNPG